MVEKSVEFEINVEFMEATLRKVPVNINQVWEVKSVHKDLDPENEVNKKVIETYICYICS